MSMFPTPLRNPTAAAVAGGQSALPFSNIDRFGSWADETELRQALPLHPQQQTESLQRKIFQLRASCRLVQRNKMR
jgi:hypothetical protein